MPDESTRLSAWLTIPHAEPVTQNSEPLASEVTALFHEMRVPLLRYTLSLGLASSDAEDIVQEVFLALFRHLRDGKPRGNLRGWIFRVGHNLALKRREQTGTAAEIALPDPAPNPEQQLIQQRTQARLQAVVRSLPERDRWCLLLRSEGLRYRDIAATLGISLGSVAMSISRSLHRIHAARERF
ncbi:MAG: sigma-70 family RNA polymerase sigma factor [Acidobacteria bacterium]|nr:sigma-70 family RNA polymerase sigma factor [Acidobacteriota bacterium]